MGGADKRREKRVPHTTHVVVHVQSAPGRPDLDDVTFPCITVDIAESGVRLKTDRVLPMYTMMDMDITLQDRVHSLTGCVVWSDNVAENKAFAGIRFTDGDERLWPWKLEVARTFRAGA